MRFAEQVEAAAYFFVSEALANVIKHARASSVRLELAADGGRLRVTVRDDGVGIRDGAAGSGLFGLADRLDASAARSPSITTAAPASRPSCPCESTPVPDVLRVVLAEDNYLVREGTRRLLTDTGDVDVVAAVGDANELLDAVRRLQPDAVVTDIRMPPEHHMDGIRAAHAIRTKHPDVGVVVLSQHADEAYAFELLKEGMARLAYLLKDRIDDTEDLLRALREVRAGRSVIDPIVVESLVARRERALNSPLVRRYLAQ